jgi:general secretion pathway protein G
MHYQFEKIRARRRAEGKEPGLIDSGFTLIELLIVIVVLGILAAVVIFAMSGVSKQSAQSACNADAKSIEVAAEAYNNQHGGFPSTVSALVPSYLHAVPSSDPTHYTIGPNLESNGAPDVATPGHAAVSYDSASNPCDNAS